MTAVITGERGEGQLTRYGLEEYVSDCVILLDNRVIDQVTTRRLRIVKYRGTTHGSNEYPFVIDETGINVLPITSLGLEHEVSEETISSGIPDLNAMLGGDGFFRGSSVMVTGTPGTGKTSLAAHFAEATCRRGEKCLYFAFEESPAQIVRNMRSIGLDLEPWVHQGLLRFHAVRSTVCGLEAHLTMVHQRVQKFQPHVVIFDPVDSMVQAGTLRDATAMLTRLIDFLKVYKVTAFLTNLIPGGHVSENTGLNISSLVDTWIFLRDIELDGERNRALYVLKSRGMAHSNQIREFLLTPRGIDLQDVYLGPDRFLTGSARHAQETREKSAALVRRQEIEAKRRERDRKREALESRIVAWRKEFDAEEKEMDRIISQEQTREQRLQDAEKTMASGGKSDVRPKEAARDHKRR